MGVSRAPGTPCLEPPLAGVTRVPASAIHLDTSFLIRALVRGSDADQMLRSWLREGHRLAMSSIAWTELLCGPLDATDRELAERSVAEPIPYDERDAEAAAELFNETGRRRGSLLDCMIAAVAQRRGASLATSNPDDFRRFESLGLRLASSTVSQPDTESDEANRLEGEND